MMRSIIAYNKRQDGSFEILGCNAGVRLTPEVDKSLIEDRIVFGCDVVVFDGDRPANQLLSFGERRLRDFGEDFQSGSSRLR